MYFVHQIYFIYHHNYSTDSREQLARQNMVHPTHRTTHYSLCMLCACIITMLKLHKHGYSNHTRYYNLLIARTPLHCCACT